MFHLHPSTRRGLAQQQSSADAARTLLSSRGVIKGYVGLSGQALRDDKGTARGHRRASTKGRYVRKRARSSRNPGNNTNALGEHRAPQRAGSSSRTHLPDIQTNSLEPGDSSKGVDAAEPTELDVASDYDTVEDNAIRSFSPLGAYSHKYDQQQQQKKLQLQQSATPRVTAQISFAAPPVEKPRLCAQDPSRYKFVAGNTVLVTGQQVKSRPKQALRQRKGRRPHPGTSSYPPHVDPVRLLPSMSALTPGAGPAEPAAKHAASGMIVDETDYILRNNTTPHNEINPHNGLALTGANVLRDDTLSVLTTDHVPSTTRRPAIPSAETIATLTLPHHHPTAANTTNHGSVVTQEQAPGQGMPPNGNAPELPRQGSFEYTFGGGIHRVVRDASGNHRVVVEPPDCMLATGPGDFPPKVLTSKTIAPVFDGESKSRGGGRGHIDGTYTTGRTSGNAVLRLQTPSSRRPPRSARSLSRAIEREIRTGSSLVRHSRASTPLVEFKPVAGSVTCTTQDFFKTLTEFCNEQESNLAQPPAGGDHLGAGKPDVADVVGPNGHTGAFFPMRTLGDFRGSVTTPSKADELASRGNTAKSRPSTSSAPDQQPARSDSATPPRRKRSVAGERQKGIPHDSFESASKSPIVTWLPLFQNGANKHDLRCVLRPSTKGAGCRTRLESRISIKNDTHFTRLGFQANSNGMACHVVSGLPFTPVVMGADTDREEEVFGTLHELQEQNVPSLRTTLETEQFATYFQSRTKAKRRHAKSRLLDPIATAAAHGSDYVLPASTTAPSRRTPRLPSWQKPQSSGYGEVRP